MSQSHALSVMEQLLISGGDGRIALDAQSGLNRYGCQPHPDDGLLAFASSTASVISQAGFDAASHLHERLLSGHRLPAQEMQRIRAELRFDVSDLAGELLFSQSGTDAHCIAARYAAIGSNRPLQVLMVEEAETGSGVFAALSALADGTPPIMVRLREEDGAPRPVAQIDAEVAARVDEAVSCGAQVLLIMVDQSKTGLIAPGVSCVMQLQQRYRERLNVLVDACQFRLSTTTLRAYLQQGFMIAVTGSKFYTGPAFSAALLMPQSGIARMDQRDEDMNSPGLALRWEAALAEWRRFRRQSAAEVMHSLQLFRDSVGLRLISDPCFEPLPVPQLDRRPLVDDSGWDHIQSIFPFLLLHSNGMPLSREQTHRVYRQMQVSIGTGIAAVRGQLGQPVVCGVRDGVEVSALRLCLSARLISDALTHRGMDAVIRDAQAVLDKAAWLVGKLA